MKYLKTLMLLLAVVVAVSACTKKDNLTNSGNIIGLGGDTWEKTEIDKWLYDSITKPYNIAVKYKWDQFELDLEKTLTPPDESKIIPMWSMFRKIWIEPYIATGGEVFFKKYAPKTFVIVGSNSYNSNGSITLGTAGSATKVVLYSTNEFRVKGMPGYSAARDSARIKEYFIKVIYHEFSHVLHQTVLYSQDFKRINADYYQSSNWINVNNAYARADGFITPYAMSAFDEDFAEMIANMLIEGKNGYAAILARIPDATSVNGVTRNQAISYLKKKENLIVAYFKQVWNIDFYDLQSRCRSAVELYI